jgi:hypothetical protein
VRGLALLFSHGYVPVFNFLQPTLLPPLKIFQSTLVPLLEIFSSNQVTVIEIKKNLHAKQSLLRREIGLGRGRDRDEKI